jgi:hypothetical protein
MSNTLKKGATDRKHPMAAAPALAQKSFIKVRRRASILPFRFHFSQLVSCLMLLHCVPRRAASGLSAMRFNMAVQPDFGLY